MVSCSQRAKKEDYTTAGRRVVVRVLISYTSRGTNEHSIDKQNSIFPFVRTNRNLQTTDRLVYVYIRWLDNCTYYERKAYNKARPLFLVYFDIEIFVVN